MRRNYFKKMALASTRSIHTGNFKFCKHFDWDHIKHCSTIDHISFVAIFAFISLKDTRSLTSWPAGTLGVTSEGHFG
jgi:hypothetical protein